MAEKKITKREKFELIKKHINVGEDGYDFSEEEKAMLNEFIDHEIDLIAELSQSLSKISLSVLTRV